MSARAGSGSHRPLIQPNSVSPLLDDSSNDAPHRSILRDPSSLSANDIGIKQVLNQNGGASEETFYQVEIENEELLRTTRRSDLASKNALLARRWQILLIGGIIIVSLCGGIGGLAYWTTIPKVITQPYLLYGESCYMNSRSCDATRNLWCPAGTCICTGNYQWNTTAQNCSCGAYQTWTGFKCQNYGYYGDPCSSTLPCQPTLTCQAVVNQTYTTGQSVCVCDNTTYLLTNGSSAGTCVTKLTYNASCLTTSDCQSWLGLSCTSVSSSLLCRCGSTAYWNGSICANNALGGQACSGSVPCDTTRGLSCVSSICQCDAYSYWDNVTSQWCQPKKTYATTCQYDFQCNTTVNLSCPSASTGCNCYSTSYAYMCDCAVTDFWDGQRCTTRHLFNSTCPGQYACGSNLVCYLGHCICSGNMVWNNPTPNTCACSTGTTWNSTINSCL